MVVCTLVCQIFVSFNLHLRFNLQSVSQRYLSATLSGCLKISQSFGPVQKCRNSNAAEFEEEYIVFVITTLKEL